MIESLTNLDIAILKFINLHLSNVVFDRLMSALSFIGNGGMVWIILSLAMLIDRRYRKAGILTLCALVLTYTFGDIILKHLIQRDRPFVGLPDIKLLVPKPTTFSFPSGHTASSFAAAFVLAHMFGRYRIPIFLLAGLIAFSRLYLYVHYPSDVLAGAILGFGCARITLHSLNNRLWCNKV
ncbi:MAG: phosphatase PAP2 family protein [Clostridia bacterium]|nr:phosphatase PAP2 family protein [Clostridia bacterium]